MYLNRFCIMFESHLNYDKSRTTTKLLLGLDASLLAINKGMMLNAMMLLLWIHITVVKNTGYSRNFYSIFKKSEWIPRMPIFHSAIIFCIHRCHRCLFHSIQFHFLTFVRVFKKDKSAIIYIG